VLYEGRNSLISKNGILLTEMESMSDFDWGGYVDLLSKGGNRYPWRIPFSVLPYKKPQRIRVIRFRKC